MMIVTSDVLMNQCVFHVMTFYYFSFFNEFTNSPTIIFIRKQ